ncbi:hypothetical protein BHE74_00012235 [Ensete ventricosum]|nr:hypothetical protein GW17_00004034 [Ensete ventricosum]RWW79460.1 hypothetical protein BHE74_00012235 [Ensete ventricosum]RZR84761.1 hypothetical protein BHM03_00011639 [Ensete ventricosum]
MLGNACSRFVIGLTSPVLRIEEICKLTVEFCVQLKFRCHIRPRGASEAADPINQVFIVMTLSMWGRSSGCFAEGGRTQCLTCHERHEAWGKRRGKKATPMLVFLPDLKAVLWQISI